MGKAGFVIGGLVFGALIGYPVSYFFQPGLLRAFISIGDYVQHAGDILGNKDMASTAIGVWVGCALGFAVLGGVLAAMVGAKKSPAA